MARRARKKLVTKENSLLQEELRPDLVTADFTVLVREQWHCSAENSLQVDVRHIKR
jgi:hypothetical protein